MSLFTSSPTARGKGGAPNNAILAFVSHEERKRFKTTFEYQRILSPLITMDMRELIINDVTSERNNNGGNYNGGSSHHGSSHQNAGYYNGGYPQYPYYNGGYPQYGYNDASRSYQHYLHPYYPQTGYAASANYPSNWPELGQASPMSTPARPPTGQTAAPWISPAFQRYHRGLDYGPQGGPGVFDLGLTGAVWRGRVLRGYVQDSKSVAASFLAVQCVEFEATMRLNLRDDMSCSWVVATCRSMVGGGRVSWGDGRGSGGDTHTRGGGQRPRRG